MVVWHGTVDEVQDFTKALLNNPPHQPNERCPLDCLHRTMNSQRAIDRILFARWRSEQMRAEEFNEQ